MKPRVFKRGMFWWAQTGEGEFWPFGFWSSAIEFALAVHQ